MSLQNISTLFSLGLLSLINSQASTVVFSADFNFANGPLAFNVPASFIGGSFAAGGVPTGSVFIDNETLVVAAEGGNNGVSFETNAASTSGRFAFDLQLRTLDVLDPMAETRIFVQLSSGAFSTAASPSPNFTDNFIFDEHGAETGINNVEYFFNTSGTDISITGGDGIARNLTNGSFALFVNNTLQFIDNTNSVDGAGIPTAGVDTLSLQLFDIDATTFPDPLDPTAPPLTKIGTSFGIDNLTFETFSTVPEPTSTLLLGLSSFAFLSLRRRKNL